MKADDSIHIIRQMMIKGDIQPKQQIAIDANDVVESFPLANDFGLDLKGESLRVVTIPVITIVPFSAETRKKYVINVKKSI